MTENLLRQLPQETLLSMALDAIKIDTIIRNDGKGLINGYVTVPKDRYDALQLSTLAGTRLYFNDSLIVNADDGSNITAKLSYFLYEKVIIRLGLNTSKKIQTSDHPTSVSIIAKMARMIGGGISLLRW